MKKLLIITNQLARNEKINNLAFSLKINIYLCVYNKEIEFIYLFIAFLKYLYNKEEEEGEELA